VSEGLGNKCQCPDCGAKFYDMHKSPACCPKCSCVLPVKRAALAVSTPVVVAPKPKKPVRVKVLPVEALDGMAPVEALEQLDEFDEDDVGHLHEVEDHHEAPDVDMNSDDAEDQMFLDELSDGDPHLVDDPDDEEDAGEAELR